MVAQMVIWYGAALLHQTAGMQHHRIHYEFFIVLEVTWG